jgi:hypothetical protein
MTKSEREIMEKELAGRPELLELFEQADRLTPEHQLEFFHEVRAIWEKEQVTNGKE